MLDSNKNKGSISKIPLLYLASIVVMLLILIPAYLGALFLLSIPIIEMLLETLPPILSGGIFASILFTIIPALWSPLFLFTSSELVGEARTPINPKAIPIISLCLAVAINLVALLVVASIFPDFLSFLCIGCLSGVIIAIKFTAESNKEPKVTTRQEHSTGYGHNKKRKISSSEKTIATVLIVAVMATFVLSSYIVYENSNQPTNQGSTRSTPATAPRTPELPSTPPSHETNNNPQIPGGAIDWTEAGQHVGETVTVYGKVMKTNYASSSNGRPTFIDIGAAYPSTNRVSIVIWGDYRGNFSPAPETKYSGKTICVTGTVYLYEGTCNIEVQSPSQIQVIE